MADEAEGQELNVTELSARRLRMQQKLLRDFGPVIPKLLKEDDVVEIIVNPDGTLWVERLGKPLGVIGQLGATPTESAARADTIIRDMAGYYGFVVTQQSPRVQAVVPWDGSRFHGLIPPNVDAPCFAIRRRASRVFELDEYVSTGVMRQDQCDLIKTAIAEHRNILVVGGTGSGKTTLLNAVIRQMTHLNPQERLLIIEDTAELQAIAANRVNMLTSEHCTMSDLLKDCLRLRPDRILVGEVRGKEALDMLMAWNTGHEGGCATIHANNAAAGLTRLATLVRMADNPPNPIEPVIGEAVHVLVHISRTAEGRRIHGVLEVGGYRDSLYGFQAAA